MVRGDLADRYSISEAEAGRIVEREQRIIGNLAALPSPESRRVVNLPEAMGYGPGCGTVRAGLTINFTDASTGERKSFQVDVAMRSKGQYRSILKEALDAAIIDAVNRDYNVPFIGVMDTSGPDNYRIDFIECR